MMWIFLALLMLLLIVAWVGIGMLLLARDARKQGHDYQRHVEGRVYTIGDNIEVALRLIAPAEMPLADDHDVVLALDHSGSMGAGPGSPLRESLRAAENFTRRLPDNMHVGVVGFDHEARLLCPLTGDHRNALRAIGAINSGGGTAIHAGLERSHAALREGRANVKKTVILLSDGGSSRDAAVKAANQLRQDPANICVICVGFGPQVDEALMRTIASDEEKYVHVDKPDDLEHLFGLLAAFVSGQMAVAGLVDEGTWSPHPFRLTNTGGLYPIGVQPGVEPVNPTRIIWSVPMMEEGPVPLTYNLVPHCPGWHSVATPDSKARWHMPDGKKRELNGPTGPHVLVLPQWLGWAWPILNPLFWMLFGRFWPCAIPHAERASSPAIEPLPTPTFPALLPAPQEHLYEPQVRPALVIGLGVAGEWAVCRLKERLQDREIEPAKVELAAIHVTHKVNRTPAKVRRVTLDTQEQIELHQDLRPYLEKLRRQGTPPMRTWVPWRQWLAQMQPLTTARTIADDRRKARLALIQRPDPVETRLAASLERVIEQDGIVIVVGAAADAECSGLLAEVAHICAERGAGVTAIFTPVGARHSAASVLALAQELERMTFMSGKHIVSDRHDPLASARKLFDRIVVLEQPSDTDEQASMPMAELIWDMLAYEEVFKSLPALRSENEEIVCCGVMLNGQALPDASLWRWVRERTLVIGINGQRLGLTEKQGRLVLPAVDRQSTGADVEAFWSGQYCSRPQNFLLSSSRAVLQSGSSDPISALLALQNQLPVDSPYHEQVAYSQREREIFTRYLEEWCQYILQREQDKGGWGIQNLIAAVLQIEDDLNFIVDRITRLSGNTDFAILISFASSLYADFLAVISNLRSELARWIAALVGPQLNWQVVSLPDDRTPVCYDIEDAGQAAEEELFVLNEGSRDFLNKSFDEWFRNYGDPILGQLRFGAEVGLNDQRLGISLRHHDQRLSPDIDLAAVIRSMLDQYRGIVRRWPLDQWVSPENVSDPIARFRVGKYSSLVYPNVRRAVHEDDPFTVAAIRVQDRPLRNALGVTGAALAGDLPYAWPEEANAARIAQKMRNRLNYNPYPFSPLVVHLMRDTRKLQDFMSDLAEGRIVAHGTRFILRRNGQEYQIGPTNESLRGLDAFHAVVQQVVSMEASLNRESIPPSQATAPQTYEETLLAIESHPLGKEAAHSPDWKMWRDVIRGLALEHDGQSSAAE